MSRLRFLLPSLLLSIASTIALYLVAGFSLGLFLGAILLVTVLLPPLVLSSRNARDRFWISGAVLLPFLAAWVIATVSTNTRWDECLACAGVLSAWGAALMGTAWALDGLRWPAMYSAGATIGLAFLWLTSPIWLSPTWSGTASSGQAAGIASVHPGLVINAQLVHLGIWMEHSVAYHLTGLSQDVPVTLTRSVWPSMLAHLLVGAMGVAACMVRFRGRAMDVGGESSLPAESVIKG